MGSEDAAVMAFAGLAFIILCVAGAIAAIVIGGVIIYKVAKRRRNHVE